MTVTLINHERKVLIRFYLFQRGRALRHTSTNPSLIRFDATKNRVKFFHHSIMLNTCITLPDNLNLWHI